MHRRRPASQHWKPSHLRERLSMGKDRDPEATGRTPSKSLSSTHCELLLTIFLTSSENRLYFLHHPQETDFNMNHDNNETFNTCPCSAFDCCKECCGAVADRMETKALLSILKFPLKVEMVYAVKAELETRGYQFHQHLAVVPHTDIQRDTQ